MSRACATCSGGFRIKPWSARDFCCSLAWACFSSKTASNSGGGLILGTTGAVGTSTAIASFSSKIYEIESGATNLSWVLGVDDTSFSSRIFVIDSGAAN